MKKKLEIKGLNCANCAAKIEEAISHLDGVNSVRVSYLTEKIKYDLDDNVDFDALIDQSNDIADRIEPGSYIIKD